MIGMAGSSIVEKASQKTKGKVQQVDANKPFLYIYLVFICLCTIVYQSYHGLGRSTLITFNVSLQLLAYCLLAAKVLQQRSVAGVSAKALQCHAVVYMSRLSTTLWLKGYIPTDPTGDWLYQACDAMSLATILGLLYLCFYRYNSTYQEDLDTFDITYLLAGCFILAVLLHPHLNGRPMFDTMWTLALYVDVFAMMPQLWMVAKLEVGAEVEALNAHYIAAIAASRAVSLYFWYYGFREFAPKDGSFNLTGWAIMGAHVIQVLLFADFVAFYVKACIKGCVRSIQTGTFSQPAAMAMPVN